MTDLTKLSDAELLAMLPKQAPEPAPQPARYSPQNIAGAAIEPNLSMLSGMIATPLSGLMGLAGTALPGEPGQGARMARQVSEGLTYRPRTQGGKDAQEVIGAPFRKIEEGADWAGEKAAELSGSPAVGAGSKAAITGAQAALFAALLKGTPPAETLQGKAGIRLMQSAVKPTLADLKSGDANRAFITMLDEGINGTMGGMEKTNRTARTLDDRVKDAVANSTAKVPVSDVAAGADRLASKVTGVNREADLGAIEASKQEFLRDPRITSLSADGQSLADALLGRTQAKVSALQDAGRYQTMAAQQENLAQGGGIRGTATPLNEPYINVGAAPTRLSPSAYPNIEYPRIPGRYTENIQRVPEAKGAAEDAIAIFRQRQAEEAAAQQALNDWHAGGGAGIPVQLAQAMKQGTYRSIGEKSYGEIGSASIEAQKALASALRQGVADKVPEVVAPLKREAALMNVKDVAERRALQEANKNPQGLAALRVDNPMAWMGFMADKSALIKSMLARSLYSSADPRMTRLLAGSSAVSEGNQ